MFGFGKGDTNSLTMNASHPDSLLDTSSQDVIGKPIDRIDGPKKVSGKATYAAEYALDNVAYGYLVRATVGAGKITSLDASRAKALPGVIDVITDYASFIRKPQQGGETTAPTQGVEDVAYHGEIIAIVIAESYEAARDAALHVDVQYDAAEGRYDFEAHKSEAEEPKPQQIPPHHDQGDIDKAMADAAFTVDVTYTTPSQNSVAMEPHASIASWDGDKVTLWTSNQMINWGKKDVAKTLGIPPENVRLDSPFVGGGFGGKLFVRADAIMAALGAKAAGRPVKVALTRPMMFNNTTHRPATIQRIRLGCDRSGKINAIAHESVSGDLPDGGPETATAAIRANSAFMGSFRGGGGQLVYTPKIIQLMKENNLHDVLLLVGGVFPKEEIPVLKKMGVDEVFMNSPTQPIIAYIKNNVKQR